MSVLAKPFRCNSEFYWPQIQTPDWYASFVDLEMLIRFTGVHHATRRLQLFTVPQDGVCKHVVLCGFMEVAIACSFLFTASVFVFLRTSVPIERCIWLRS